jgi:hypothetical protein
MLKVFSNKKCIVLNVIFLSLCVSFLDLIHSLSSKLSFFSVISHNVPSVCPSAMSTISKRSETKDEKNEDDFLDKRRKTNIFVPQLSKERRKTNLFVPKLSKERRQTGVFVPQPSKKRRKTNVFVPQLSKGGRKTNLFVPKHRRNEDKPMNLFLNRRRNEEKLMYSSRSYR